MRIIFRLFELNSQLLITISIENFIYLNMKIGTEEEIEIFLQIIDFWRLKIYNYEILIFNIVKDDNVKYYSLLTFVSKFEGSFWSELKIMIINLKFGIDFDIDIYDMGEKIWEF